MDADHYDVITQVFSHLLLLTHKKWEIMVYFNLTIAYLYDMFDHTLSISTLEIIDDALVTWLENGSGIGWKKR